MNRKILCHYCTKCRKPTHENWCCDILTNVYTSKGNIEPNFRYIPNGGIKANGTDEFYCTRCGEGKTTRFCPVHGSLNRRLHNGYYIGANSVRQLTSRRIRSKEEKSEAISKCREFIANDIIGAKKTTKEPITEDDKIWKPMTKDDEIWKPTIVAEDKKTWEPTIVRICPVCRTVVGIKKHCERYTKIIDGNALVPAPVDFPLYYECGIEYGGKYYCSICKEKGESFICKCGRFASHRWFETMSDKAYVFIPDLHDFETTVKLGDT